MNFIYDIFLLDLRLPSNLYLILNSKRSGCWTIQSKIYGHWEQLMWNLILFSWKTFYEMTASRSLRSPLGSATGLVLSIEPHRIESNRNFPLNFINVYRISSYNFFLYFFRKAEKKVVLWMKHSQVFRWAETLWCRPVDSTTTCMMSKDFILNPEKT